MGTGSSLETSMQFRNSGCRAVGSTCSPHAYDLVVSSSTYWVKTTKPHVRLQIEL